MAKVKKTTVVVKCECNVCKQVAHVSPNTQHFYCNGIKVTREMPKHLQASIKHPDTSRKGVWVPVQA